MYGRLGPDRRKRYGLSSNSDLFDPATNASVALDIYKQAGGSFRPWGAYTNGSYKRHLTAARDAAKRLGGDVARLVKSLLKLRSEVDAMAPARSKASDGWIGDPAHSSRSSDHNPEPDGTVDAIDITHDPRHGCDCNDLVRRIVTSRDKRVKYIIWNRQIISGSQGPSPWAYRRYTGSNPHDKHMHVSVLDRYQDDTSSWLEGGFLMALSDKEQQELLEKVRRIDIAITAKDDASVKKATGRATGSVLNLLSKLAGK